MALDVHIVSHTHWDREWYQPLERFRQRLVALIDELLEGPPDRTFLLDGQTILLEDYLAVRPERADALAARLRSGALEAGPWYVLADELIPSGEALVRNLFAGRRVLSRFGASSPPVLYCPDSFGHPAALPNIAYGFGLPVVILWRGYGGFRDPAGDTARWTGLGGESVVLFHLPRDGYEFGSHLPADDAGAAARWDRMRRELAPRSTTGVLLVPNGADHHALQVGADAAISALERAGAADNVHRSSLAAFAGNLIARASTEELPRVSGELRDSYGYTWTLQGTFATRAHEKRLNAQADRLLVREAEPWSALASRRGASRRAFVESAWRSVLSAHPHDTLCGCSIDDVALAMEQRLRSARNEAVGIRGDAIADLIQHDAVAAREARHAWRTIALVRNAAPRVRSGVAIIDLERFVVNVPVGPGSGGGPTLDYLEPGQSEYHPDQRKAALIPALGKLQVLDEETRHSRVESPRHYPVNDLVAAHVVAAWVTAAPPYGVVAYEVDGGEFRDPKPSAPVVVDGTSMRNAFLAVSVTSDGVVTLEDRLTGRRIERLLEITDECDLGDLYTPAPSPLHGTIDVSAVFRDDRGPLRGSVTIWYRVRDGVREGVVDVKVRLVLDADSRFLRVEVEGDNRLDDHRLRLAFHGDVMLSGSHVDETADGYIHADAAFGVQYRRPIRAVAMGATAETAPPTAPLHRYVTAIGEAKGFTVFSDGLAEYEASDDGTITVTLLRAVGQLSKNHLHERPGHAGWPVPTPLAQCRGPFAGAFAVMLHGGNTVETMETIEHAADDFLLPLTGETLRSALSVPKPVPGVELAGVGLAFSALKESENGEWLVLRCVNHAWSAVAGSWRLPFEPREAHVARLDETIVSDLECEGPVVRFTAEPSAIVTILVR